MTCHIEQNYANFQMMSAAAPVFISLDFEMWGEYYDGFGKKL